MQGQIREMAALLQGMGRGGDTILAHINPQEAMLLDAVTDGGSINPVTGMPEFMLGDDVDHGLSPDPGPEGDYGISMQPDSPMLHPLDDPIPDPNSPNNVQDSEPSLLGAILTAPIEVLGNIFGIDYEATGRDVFGPDISRAMAGIDTPQPAGTVEINPLGVVGSVFGGPIGGLAGSAITPTYTVGSSGVVGQHGGLDNTIEGIAGLFDAPPSWEESIENALGLQPVNPDQNLVTQDGVLPPDPIMGGDEPEYFPVARPIARPEEVADAIIQQQEMARVLTMPQPGYTRAGQGLIYL